MVLRGVSARAALPMYGVSCGVHLQAVPGDSHAHTYRGAPLRVRCLLQTLHAEIHAQHPQANTHRYEIWVHRSRASLTVNVALQTTNSIL